MKPGDLLSQRINGDVAPGIAAHNAEALAAASIGGMAPHAVVYPASEAQVAATLAFAGRGGWTVMPWGSGSSRQGAVPPERYDIALMLGGLGQVLDHDRENLTLTAQAGLALAEANRQLAPKHQFLPLGFSFERRTLGGLVASNRTPPQRLVYGDTRDQILGLRVAMADGTLVRYGRKVLKNVAGYDMNKVFLGSEGQLGVIVELTLKLAALPDTTGYLIGTFAQAGDVFTAASKFFSSALQPSGIFVLDGPAGTALRSGQGLSAAIGPTTLIVSFEGRGVTVKRQLTEGGKMMAECGANAVENQERLTERAASLLTRPGEADSASDVILRLGAAPTELAKIWHDLAVDFSPPDNMRRIADYGSGQIRVALTPAWVDSKATRKIEALRARISTLRGYLVVQAAPSEFRSRVAPWGDLGGEDHLMRLMKAQFDPKGTLAPGRFVG